MTCGRPAGAVAALLLGIGAGACRQIGVRPAFNHRASAHPSALSVVPVRLPAAVPDRYWCRRRRTRPAQGGYLQRAGAEAGAVPLGRAMRPVMGVQALVPAIILFATTGLAAAKAGPRFTAAEIRH